MKDQEEAVGFHTHLHTVRARFNALWIYGMSYFIESWLDSHGFTCASEIN